MKNFTCVQDIGNLKTALDEAFEIKKDRFKYVELGRNKTLMMIFFNSSLRTRLSTQKAALNLGMNVIVLDINQGAWKLETERGVIMDGDKPEHLLEAIPVPFGSTSFITFPSILNTPSEISSKPAIIRSVVDLPHPDGPTKMMNSLSAISRLKSFTAWNPFG